MFNSIKSSKSLKSLLVISIIALGISGNSYADAKDERDKHSDTDTSSERVISGYVSHGINTYNNETVFDYSKVSPTIFMFDARVIEVGAFIEGGQTAEPITIDTDRNRVLATTRVPFDFFNPGGEIDDSLFNRTLDAIGANFLGFANIAQRAPIVPFETASAGDLYRANNTTSRPTVGDWEKISGQMNLICRTDGTANVKITIHDAFPNGVYTLWDVGVHDPLTDQERPYVTPFGGLPNTILTDDEGCGYKNMELAFCPQTCSADTKSCTGYVSAFYHWDSETYGGSPDATFAGMPGGVIASNHMAWSISGETSKTPTNRFRSKREGCSKLSKHKKHKKHK